MKKKQLHPFQKKILEFIKQFPVKRIEIVRTNTTWMPSDMLENNKQINPNTYEHS
jgi:hypothetical protein